MKCRLQLGSAVLWSFDIHHAGWWGGHLFLDGSLLYLLSSMIAFFGKSEIQGDIGSAYAISWINFFGSLIVVAAAYSLLLEALNPKHAERFGHVVASHLTSKSGTSQAPEAYGDAKLLNQQESSTQIELGVRGASAAPAASGDVSGPGSSDWRWWGYDKDNLAWWSAFFWLVGCIVFILPSITGIPQVLSDTIEWDLFYWVPSVIAAMFMVMASTSTMFIAQDYKVFAWRPFDAEWLSGLFFLIGSFGYLCVGLFGFNDHQPEYLKWGSRFSFLYGSVFFCLGSYALQFHMQNPVT